MSGITEPALDIESLSLSIRGSSILRRVSARIGPGETWSVIGPNGAGKSSLLKCLMRIHRDWSGVVRLSGRPLTAFSQRALARQMAYVPQAGESGFFPYTVREFVRMSRYAFSGPFGSAHPDDRQAVDAAMHRAGVRRFRERSLNSLSGGERQKVFIAAALAQGGHVLLMDEPAAFLDYCHQADVYGILRGLNRDSGTTIITVTHDVNAAMLMGGHALALREGEVVWTGPAGDLASERLLTRIFDARFRFIRDPVTGHRLVVPQGAMS